LIAAADRPNRFLELQLRDWRRRGRRLGEGILRRWRDDWLRRQWFRRRFPVDFFWSCRWLHRGAGGSGSSHGRLLRRVCDGWQRHPESAAAERALGRLSQLVGAHGDRTEAGRASHRQQRLRMECRRREGRCGGIKAHGRMLRTRTGCAASAASSPDRSLEGRGGPQTRTPWPASLAAPRADATPPPAR